MKVLKNIFLLLCALNIHFINAKEVITSDAVIVEGVFIQIINNFNACISYEEKREVTH